MITCDPLKQDSTGTDYKYETLLSDKSLRAERCKFEAHSPEYSANGLRNKQFSQMIHRLAPYLLEMAKKASTNVFAVRGTSGISVANAIRMLDIDIQFVMVRKGEASHGTHVEALTSDFCTFTEYVFLDDFIASGYTRGAVEKALAPAKMKGMVLYQSIKNSTSRGSLDWGQYDGILRLG